MTKQNFGFLFILLWFVLFYLGECSVWFGVENCWILQEPD